MPSSAPLVRAMDWAIIKECLPREISVHLPDCDPVNNKGKVKRSIKQLRELGPKGKLIVDEYVDGEIDEDEMNKRLDNLSDSINMDQYEVYQRNLDAIISMIDIPAWKQIMPLVSSTFNKKEMKSIALELHELDLYKDSCIGSKTRKEQIESKIVF
jgi:hypothetical protein